MESRIKNSHMGNSRQLNHCGFDPRDVRSGMKWRQILQFSD